MDCGWFLSIEMFLKYQNIIILVDSHFPYLFENKVMQIVQKKKKVKLSSQAENKKKAKNIDFTCKFCNKLVIIPWRNQIAVTWCHKRNLCICGTPESNILSFEKYTRLFLLFKRVLILFIRQGKNPYFVRYIYHFV